MGAVIQGEIPFVTKWSYTRLSAFEQCPYSYYLKYVMHQFGDGNFYSEMGVAMHKTLELLAKGELKVEDAIPVFDKLWGQMDDTCIDVPQSTVDNTYWKCVDYLGGLTGHELDGYNVLEIEGKHEFTRDGNTFVGIIDLLLEDKEDGGLIIVDHKSHGKLLGKNGQPLKREAKTLEGYKHQLYMYSTPIMEKYKKTPKNFAWNHFKTGDLTVIPFDWNEYRASWEWVNEMIGKIQNEEAFENNDEFFFCNRLCNFRHSCEYQET